MPIVVGRKGIRRVKTRSDSWTLKKRTLFLDALSQTCNATMAAKASGMNPQSARSLKRRDAEFARLWAEAITLGAERLEEELLAHSLNPVTTAENPVGERDLGPPIPFDPKAAIAALKQRGGFHSSNRRAARSLPTQAEVDVALMARLEALAAKAAKAAKVAGGGPEMAEPEKGGGGA